MPCSVMSVCDQERHGKSNLEQLKYKAYLRYGFVFYVATYYLTYYNLLLSTLKRYNTKNIYIVEWVKDVEMAKEDDTETGQIDGKEIFAA